MKTTKTPHGQRLLKKIKNLSLKSQDKYFFKKYGHLVSVMRRDPVRQARLLHGITLPPHERAILRPTRDPSITEYHVVGSRGTAKCLALGTRVIMADGSLKEVEDIVVGDRIMGPRGQASSVVDTTRGTGPMYRVQQFGGEDYEVNEDHILSLVVASPEDLDLMESAPSARVYTTSDTRFPWRLEIEVRDFVKQSSEFCKKAHGHKAPALELPHRPVSLDPYTLGVWLGGFSDVNPLHRSHSGPLFPLLRRYGVHNNARRIPTEYLTNSLDIRRHLLAGIVDSLGRRESPHTWSMEVSYDSLADDICYLANISGLQALKITSGSSFGVVIHGNLASIPVRSPAVEGEPYEHMLCPRIQVEPLGEGDYAGFTLDEDPLFLLEDGTVTHNSFTVASVNPVLYAEAYGRKKVMSLSASKFRGGKVIMEEALSFIMGTLDSQKLPGRHTKRMLQHGRGLKREGDRWYIPFTTQTTFNTVPTGNEESARGLRAHRLVLDEADNWMKSTVDKIFGPFLAVGGNFARPGSETSDNKIFFTGTVTHAHKDWAKALKDRENVIRKAHIAYQALAQGDHDTWNRMSSEDNERIKRANFHLQRWDYTDLIIPTRFGNYDVAYPSVDLATQSVEINDPDLIKYDYRDRVNYIYTYPVNKEFAETQLDDGLTDLESWAAEWRCQFIESSGNVFPYELIERATERELFENDELKKMGWDVEERGMYVPPVLYRCTDPCVLGVDTARTSDFVTFVVIRMGQLAEGKYDPLTGTGETPWNNVIWAEQRKGMTIRDIAAKIRELHGRYNLKVYSNPEKAPGVVIDARGAASGTTVQDELAIPSPPADEHGNFDPNWQAPDPFYDPVDKEYRTLAQNPKAWPGLRLLWTTDQMNTDLVSYVKGQMESSKLYLGKYLNTYERDDPEGVLNYGYLGVRSLKDQLLGIQAEPTKHAFKYSMPGSSQSLEGKKDLFSAFLYAAYGVRQHAAQHAVSRKAKSPQTVAIKVNKSSRMSLRTHPLMRYK